MAAATQTEVQQPPRFDTDNALVETDNRCSAWISHCIIDFLDTLRPTNQVIKGFGGSWIEEVKTGTIHWSWEDNNGMVHDQIIPNSYYVLQEGGVCLLCMQVTMSTKEKQRHASQCLNYHDHVVLLWKDKYQSTVPMNKEQCEYIHPGSGLLQVPGILYGRRHSS